MIALKWRLLDFGGGVNVSMCLQCLVAQVNRTKSMNGTA